jgi:DNA-cytosine methyltransferase
MNVLSLFDGISCGRVALERSGVPVANYYASEIDPHAIKIAKKNYPDTIHVGDVTKLEGRNLPQIDLILAGSPCQGFSHNGAKLGFDDPRSRLFWEFVRLVGECQPTWWLLENVRMKQEWSNIITEAVGYDPILINSALVSAQRRMRLYWTNIPQNGLPEDKGLVLKDILEKPVAEEQPMTDAEGKAYCLTATYSRCGNPTTGGAYESEIIHNTARHQRTCVRTPVDKSEIHGTKMIGRANVSERSASDRVYSTQHKSPCVISQPPVKVGEPVFEPTAPASHNHKLDKMRVIKRENWRMLTPKECERLQTLPDDYTTGVSNTQRYKALGNGWTIDVIAHLLKSISTSS